MTDSKQKLIQNLKKQLATMSDDRTDRVYVYAIQQTIKEKLNIPETPLTFISGSSNLYNIDVVKSIVDKYTPYLP